MKTGMWAAPFSPRPAGPGAAGGREAQRHQLGGSGQAGGAAGRLGGPGHHCRGDRGQARAAGGQRFTSVSPRPFLAPCYYGTDIPDDRQLIAAHHTLEEVRDILGCDSLGYLPRACLGQLFGPRAPGGILRSLFWRGLRRRHTPGHRKKTALSASGRKEKGEDD